MSLLCGVLTLFGAAVALAGNSSIAERFQKLSLAEGLSQTTALAIHEDSRGHLWFGTEDGLNRFDGESLDVYRHKPNHPSSLPANYVRAIAEDAEGRIWVGTEGGGLARLDPGTHTFVRYRKDGNETLLASNYVVATVVDHQGFVWVGLRNHGLHRLDPASGELLHFQHDPSDRSSLRSDRVTALFEGARGSLWVGTAKGVDLFDPASGSFLHTPSNQSVESLYEDQGGALWIGTRERGLQHYTPMTGELVRYRHRAFDSRSLIDDRVRALAADRSGALWVATLAGLDRYEPTEDRFVHFGEGLLHATGRDLALLSLESGSGDTLWLGTRQAGIVRWNRDDTSSARVEKPPVQPRIAGTGHVITSFAEDRRDGLFVGTFGDGLLRLDRSTDTITRFRHHSQQPGSLSDDRVMALLTDRAGRLWVGTKAGGLGRLDSGAPSFRNYTHDAADPSSLPGDGIMSLFEDAAGSIWIGTFGAGLARLDVDRETFESFSVAADRITAMADAEHGLVWAATDGGGLNLLDPATGDFRAFRQDAADPSSLPSDTILALHRDRTGTLWVGTQGAGLAKMETRPGSTTGPTFRTFGESEGLPNAVVYAIRSDRAGGLWLSTNNGLAHLDPETESVLAFDESHGLHGTEFNFGAAYASSRGELFFGGIDGYDAFRPEELLDQGGLGTEKPRYAIDKPRPRSDRARTRPTGSNRVPKSIPALAARSID